MEVTKEDIHEMKAHATTQEEIADVRGKLIEQIRGTKAAGQLLTFMCHGLAFTAGWWHDLETGKPSQKSVGDLIALIHTEVSEAYEGYRRDDRMDDKLPHRKMLEVELADAVIRIFDMAGGLDLDVAGAIEEKLRYNTERADHKVENRKAEGGKKV